MRSTGDGGEPHESSNSEDECVAHRQPGNGQGRGATLSHGGFGTGSGVGSSGDRDVSGRDCERSQGGLGTSPTDRRKLKRKGDPEVLNAMMNGREPQQLILFCSSHSDRDAAASLQDASSRSTTTMDTADASSDAADEPHAGVAESKLTVKLIQNCSGLACGPPERGVFQPGADQVLTLEGQCICVSDDGAFKPEGGAAADVPGCARCCGWVNSAPKDVNNGNSSIASEIMPLAVGSCKTEDFPIAAADASSWRAGSKSSSTSRRQSDDTAATDRLGFTSSQLEKAVGNSMGSSPGVHKAMAVAASAGTLVASACPVSQSLPPPQADVFNSPLAPVQLPLPPPPPPPSSHRHQQQRSCSNGAVWPQTHTKASPHGSEQPQQVPLHPHASSALHMPHLPQSSHHGTHIHSLQNGKVRNGDVHGDPAQWAQQMLPNLSMFVPGQGGSGSATPPPGSQPLHAHAAGQSQGLLAATLQNFLLACQSGTLQMQHLGVPLPGQHFYGLSHYQQAQQELLKHQSALLQQQLVQHALQLHVQQHAAQHPQQQAQQPQIQHEALQQLGTQGLSHMQLLSTEAQYAAASAGEPLAAFVSSSPIATTTPHTYTVPCTSAESAVETCASPAESSVQQPQGTVPMASQSLNPAPIAAPTPTIAQQQSSSAQGSDAAGQSGWDSGSASSARSEPSTAVAMPLVERPIRPQHRVQSQGNILASGHGSVTGSQLGQRDGGTGGGRSSFKGRTSFSGNGGLSTGPPGGSASSTGAAGQPSAMMPGGGAYGIRSYGGPTGSSRHGGGGFRGGRYEGGSADSSRPSSRGPLPHGGGGSHMRHPHSADPVPPPEASPWPDPKGLCDLDRFISQIEPVIAIDPAKPPQQALQELKLRDLWNFYFEPSLYGREVFTLGGHRGASNSYFVPYLSAIQIFTRALPTDVGGTNRLYVSEDNQGWPKHMHLKFEYFEQELPFNRLPLYDQIELLSSTMVAGKTAGLGPGSAGGTAGAPAFGSRQAPLAQPAFAHAAVAAPSAAGVAASPPTSTSDGIEAAADVQGAAKRAAPQAARNIDGSVEAEASEVDGPAGKMVTEAAASSELPGSEGASAVATGSAGPADSIGQGNITAGNTSTPSASQQSARPSAAQQAAAVLPLQTGTARQPPATTAATSSSEAETCHSRGGTRLLYDMRLLDVHPASWFAVAWYPVYRIPDAPLYARFLTFHSFAPLVESMRNVHERLAMGQVAPYYLLSLPVVGLNWYNMQGERWMEPLDESTVARTHDGSAPTPTPPITATAPAASVNSPRGPPNHQRGGGGGGRVPGTDVWYQQWLQNFQITADRLARGVGLKVLGQHGAEEVRLRVPDYEFFRART
ncbi:hypothetical protein Vretimale_14256 [Volvox reticuliferus]|nr:hypothetical protein Vretifemale_15254 [Volvox reticuliferus]GIM10663.1 hypothetical protein Vretimale_14256 [Volvox reticuliferus]